MEGRKDFLERAFGCFCNQTYPNREFLIVADSIEDVPPLIVEDLEEYSQQRLPYLIDPHFHPRQVHYSSISGSLLVPSAKLNIGQKRNLGCESAQGELIAVWDDDDFSDPRRLWQQIQDLYQGESKPMKSVTGYSSMKFTDGKDWWQFSYPEGFVFGTSLMFRKAWWTKHPFKELNVGEDSGFSSEAYEADELAMVPDLNLMYATIHEGNTSRKDPSQFPWIALPGFKWNAS
jgi:glycosyltransferase involved in cell wall biosynthesis